MLLAGGAPVAGPVAAVSTPAPQRTFADMPAAERRAILRTLRTEDADRLFQHFLDAGRIEGDPMKQSTIQGLLMGAIKQHTPPPEFIEKMRRFVTDRTNSVLERGLVVSAFGEAGTKTAAEFVLWVATVQPDPDMRRSACANIRYLGGRGSREYVPPMLEPLWRESKDVELVKAVAFAMAGEGAPSSITLLLHAALVPEGQDDVRREAALRALTKVATKNAVPPLEAALKGSPAGSGMHTLAFRTLIQIGDESAVQAILGWLQTTDSQAAPLVSIWIGSANYAAHLQGAENALNPVVPFRSEQNREAIRAALAAYRASSIIIGPDGKKRSRP